jgi:outer membrane protein assembly factor BamB
MPASSVTRGTAAALLLLLAGCEAARSTAATPEVPLWVHHPGGALSVQARRTLTSASREVGEPYERGRPEIDAEHRRVFVGSSDRGLYALRAETAETLWRFETLGAVQCEPLYEPNDDAVYFGSNDGALYKVQASDGRLLWRFMTNAEVARKPLVHNGVVYVVNANDTLIAIDAATGKMRWNQHRTPAFGMEIAGYAGPMIANGKVYTAFSDGVVLAYSLEDGSEQWPSIDLAAEAEQSSGGEAPRYLDVDTTPIAARIASGPVVFVASYAGGVFALDAEDGSRAWVNEKARGVTDLTLWTQPAHRPRSGEGPVVAAKTILFASSGLTGLWAIDPEDGTMLWRKSIPEGGISAPVPLAGAMLVSTTRYGVFLMSPLDGGVIDAIETGGGYAMTPAAYERRAFVMSNQGTFLALSVDAPTVGPGGF